MKSAEEGLVDLEEAELVGGVLAARAMGVSVAVVIAVAMAAVAVAIVVLAVVAMGTAVETTAAGGWHSWRWALLVTVQAPTAALETP